MRHYAISFVVSVHVTTAVEDSKSRNRKKKHIRKGIQEPTDSIRNRKRGIRKMVGKPER